MGMPIERELRYCEHKINQNFSNYSAWHYRTALLTALHEGAAREGQGADEAASAAPHPEGNEEAAQQQEQQQAQQQHEAGQQQDERQLGQQQGEGVAAAAAADAGDTAAQSARDDGMVPGSSAAATAAVPWDVLDREYELVKQAFYTEPEDQSGWFYHRWLLGARAGVAGRASINTRARGVRLRCALVQPSSPLRVTPCQGARSRGGKRHAASPTRRQRQTRC